MLKLRKKNLRPTLQAERIAKKEAKARKEKEEAEVKAKTENKKLNIKP